MTVIAKKAQIQESARIIMDSAMIPLTARIVLSLLILLQDPLY